MIQLARRHGQPRRDVSRLFFEQSKVFERLELMVMSGIPDGLVLVEIQDPSNVYGTVDVPPDVTNASNSPSPSNVIGSSSVNASTRVTTPPRSTSA